jgi:methyltransferase (TIGR00027 family)
LLTAAARALHREEPPPWVLDDWLALRLGGEEAVRMSGSLRQQLPVPALLAFTRWVCVRGRLAEDVVESAAAGGVGQYVILGAGLDSFAYRRGDLLERVRVFEVDHPASQQWKRHRLQGLGIDPPATLVYVPVDFEQRGLRDGLTAAGFDFSAPAVWSWIGVTMYLTIDAIRATLATIAACPIGTCVIFTYNLPRAALSGPGLSIDTTMRAIVSELGEPMISLFRPDEIEELVRGLGFDEVTHFGPDEVHTRYFAERDDVRFAGAQRMIIATVAE